MPTKNSCRRTFVRECPKESEQKSIIDFQNLALIFTHPIEARQRDLSIDKHSRKTPRGKLVATDRAPSRWTRARKLKESASVAILYIVSLLQGTETNGALFRGTPDSGDCYRDLRTSEGCVAGHPEER